MVGETRPVTQEQLAPGHSAPLTPQGQSRVDASPQGPSPLACVMLWGFGGVTEGTCQHRPPCTASLIEQSWAHFHALSQQCSENCAWRVSCIYVRAQFPSHTKSQTRDQSGCLLQLTCLFFLLGFCPGL